jgi:hypothetical protein
LGAVVLILNDTGSALGFVMFRERFTFRVRGPWKMASMRTEEGGVKSKERRKDARLNPNDSLG